MSPQERDSLYCGDLGIRMTLQDAFNSDRGPVLDGRSEDDILDLLQTAEIVETGLHPDGSNYVFIVRFETNLGGDVPLLGVYKPQSGERPLRDFPRGLHNRERASYLLSRILGRPAIPPTVIRDGPHGEGSSAETATARRCVCACVCWKRNERTGCGLGVRAWCRGGDKQRGCC